jgi:hypothetical protein
MNALNFLNCQILDMCCKLSCMFNIIFLELLLPGVWSGISYMVFTRTLVFHEVNMSLLQDNSITKKL